MVNASLLSFVNMLASREVDRAVDQKATAKSATLSPWALRFLIKRKPVKIEERPIKPINTYILEGFAAECRSELNFANSAAVILSEDDEECVKTVSAQPKCREVSFFDGKCAKSRHPSLEKSRRYFTTTTVGVG